MIHNNDRYLSSREKENEIDPSLKEQIVPWVPNVYDEPGELSAFLDGCTRFDKTVRVLRIVLFDSRRIARTSAFAFEIIDQ